MQVCWRIWVRARQRYLREAEEKGGGPDKEGGGCRHRDISAGSKRTGRSRSSTTYSSPNPPTTETRHQRQREREEEDRKGGRYLLPTYCKGCFSGQNGECGVCLGGWAMTGKENQHYSKQQLNGNMTDSLRLDSKCLLALIKSLKNRIFLFYLAIHSLTCMSTTCWEYLCA